MVENELPFGYQVAYQLRMVAEAVDSGRLPGPKLPPSYATVYQLATLTSEQLRLADQRNLIRPDVTRPEIVRFKRDLRNKAIDHVSRREALEAERDRLRERLAVLEAVSQAEHELAGAAEMPVLLAGSAGPRALAGKVKRAAPWFLFIVLAVEIWLIGPVKAPL